MRLDTICYSHHVTCDIDRSGNTIPPCETLQANMASAIAHGVKTLGVLGEHPILTSGTVHACLCHPIYRRWADGTWHRICCGSACAFAGPHP